MLIANNNQFIKTFPLYTYIVYVLRLKPEFHACFNVSKVHVLFRLTAFILHALRHLRWNVKPVQVDSRQLLQMTDMEYELYLCQTLVSVLPQAINALLAEELY